MLGGLDNEVLGGIAKAGALVVLTAAAKYQLDKIAVHYGITLDPNIKDIVEPTAWPTGVINPETGNEFKEFRLRRKKQDIKLEDILGHNRFLKKYIKSAFEYAKKLPGESELGFQWRRARAVMKGEVMPVGDNFILLLNLQKVVPKASFRIYMDKLESAYRANLGAIFDDDTLQGPGAKPREYRGEDYILPILMLDPTNNEMRIALISSPAITQPNYFPNPEDCVVRLAPGRAMPPQAYEDGGFAFSTRYGTFYRAPTIDRFNKLFKKSAVFQKVPPLIHANQELFNFISAIPANHSETIPMAVEHVPVRSLDAV